MTTAHIFRLPSRLTVCVLGALGILFSAGEEALGQDYSGIYSSPIGTIRLAESEGRVKGTFSGGQYNDNKSGTITGTVEKDRGRGWLYVRGKYAETGCTSAKCRGSIELNFIYHPKDVKLQIEYTPDSSFSFQRIWAERTSTDLDPTEPTPPKIKPTPQMPPISSIPQTKPPAKRIVVPGGDAGGQNSSAAKIPYPCRINGALARGDYDFYSFDFPGGVFRAYSEPGLNLVADLIRASDGLVLLQSGVEKQEFFFEGDLTAGTYILAIRVMRHAAAGSYGVVLGIPGDQVVEEKADSDQ